MVGPERLELSHIAALDPKSSASTNFATGPHLRFLFNFHFCFHLSWTCASTAPLTKQFLIVLFGRVPQAHALSDNYKFTPTKPSCQEQISHLPIFAKFAII